MKKSFLISLVLISSLVLAACSHSSDSPAAGAGGGSAATTTAGSQFPMLEDASLVSTLDGGSLNYQTAYSVAEIATFYRGEYSSLTERTLVLVEEEEVLNLVFDGSENGKALVVQVAKLGEGQFNVNVRFEEV